jgi:hypothetical protein
MRQQAILATFLVGVLQSTPSLAAPTNTEVGYIGYMGGGWINSHVRVQLTNLPNIKLSRRLWPSCSMP